MLHLYITTRLIPNQIQAHKPAICSCDYCWATNIVVVDRIAADAEVLAAIKEELRTRKQREQKMKMLKQIGQ